MKKLISLTLCSAVLPVVASAGNLTAPAPAPAPTAAAPQVADWSGPYAGLAYAKHRSDSLEFKNPAPGPYDFESDDGIGLFAGYTGQTGSIVYGGELAWYDIGDQTVTGFPTAHMNNMLDVSGRLGYAFGDVQIYGLAGYSRSKYSQTAGDWKVDGHHFGVGAEYMIGGRFTLGVQYVDRRLDGSNPNGSGQKAEIEHNTISLRGAYRF